MKLLLASVLCISMTIAITVPLVAAGNQEIDVDDLINKLQQWRQNYNDEKEINDGLHRKGPGANPDLNGKAHPVYLRPAFEKRYYNNKQMEDLYEMEKRNFDEIDGSAFSPFKRQNTRH